MHHANRCDRCNGSLALSMMSKFNTDILCTHCKDDECEAPGYAAADAAECTAVKGGDANFPGIGLALRDRAFLTARRAAHTSQTAA